MQHLTTYEENRAAELQNKFNEGLVNLELERQRQGITVDATIAKEIKKAEIKLQMEMLLMDLREAAELKKETQNLQITKNHENRLCLEVIREQNGKNFKKIIVPEELMSSKIFFCHWPIPIEAMMTKFKVNGQEVAVCMILTNTDNDYKEFVERAEAIGVRFLISGKMKADALKEVFRYLVMNSQREHRPYKRGFLNQNGNWMITVDQNMTMEAIINE